MKTNVANLKDQTQKLITNHNSKMKETEACKNMEIGNLRLMCSDLGKVRILSAVRIYQGLVDHGLSELSRIFLFENGQSRKWPVFILNSFESGLPRK